MKLRLFYLKQYNFDIIENGITPISIKEIQKVHEEFIKEENERREALEQKRKEEEKARKRENELNRKRELAKNNRRR